MIMIATMTIYWILTVYFAVRTHVMNNTAPLLKGSRAIHLSLSSKLKVAYQTVKLWASSDMLRKRQVSKQANSKSMGKMKSLLMTIWMVLKISLCVIFGTCEQSYQFLFYFNTLKIKVQSPMEYSKNKRNYKTFFFIFSNHVTVGTAILRLLCS